MNARMIGAAGVALGAAWVAVLAGVAVLNEGGPGDNVWETSSWMMVFSAPTVIGFAGVRGHRQGFLVAAIISLPVGLISMAGATLPLLVPGAFYLVAAAAWDQ